MLVEKICKIIKKPKLIVLYIMSCKLFRIVPDDIYLKVKYKLIIGKKLNLRNPQTFNEKLQWLKINDRKPKYTEMVDKYLVRKYISDTIGEKYLIPILGVYNSFDEINFDSLPNQFVLKPNHTSGNIYICKNKKDINMEKLKVEINQWLNREYYWIHREWPYKNIKPCIIAEKYMVDESGFELKDYKFMCFNGKVKCSFVCLNRNSETGLNVNFYDMDWNPLPFERHYTRSNTNINKPKNFELMVHLSELLSKEIPFVRIDFYEINGNLYFGEITFYPGSGFEEFTPEAYDYKLGSWLKLPSSELKY